jgi:aspartate/methionine/tyrosine aminotransferase
MKHVSLYLDWYIHVPSVKYDFRSSGITYFKQCLNLGEVDLSINYAHGNPEATEQLAKRYGAGTENVFISSEGASGQNARIIKCVAERSPKKNEVIVEYPTYEPLLRQVQEHFPHVKRLERREKDAYRLNADELRKVISDKTGLLVLTNPHAPSGAISDVNELREIMIVAREHEFHVLCDEIYAEFDRKAVPTLFSVDPEWGIVATSFTKAYGLGGLKLGVALAGKEIVDELYVDVLNTVGNSPNIVQLIAAELLTKGKENLEKHKQKWNDLKNQTDKWLDGKNLEYFPSKVGLTYWVKLPIKDTYTWINEQAIPHHSLAPVPGTFFLFKSDYELTRSNMIRLGLGSISPERSNLQEAFQTLEKGLVSYKCARRKQSIYDAEPEKE